MEPEAQAKGENAMPDKVVEWRRGDSKMEGFVGRTPYGGYHLEWHTPSGVEPEPGLVAYSPTQLAWDFVRRHAYDKEYTFFGEWKKIHEEHIKEEEEKRRQEEERRRREEQEHIRMREEMDAAMRKFKQRQSFDIVFTDGSRQTVQGARYGVWGIHRQLPGYPGQWRLTHIPTGKFATWATYREILAWAAVELEKGARNLNSTNPEFDREIVRRVLQVVKERGQ
jgi:head-tail adaptor